jgi:hypothetical protein
VHLTQAMTPDILCCVNQTTQIIPTSLKLVAYLFVFSGFSSLLGILLNLFAGKISVQLGVLGIFIGFGLLRLEERWRIWALAFTWFGLVVTPIFIALALSGRPIPFNVFGVQVIQVGGGVGVLFDTVLFFFHVWQHAILTDSDFHHLFS